MSSLRVLLGLVLPLLLCLTTWRVVAARTGEWRVSLALSAIAVGLFVALSTELLSLISAVNLAGLLLLYAGYLGVLVGALRSSGWSRAGAPSLPWRRMRDPWILSGGVISGTLLLVAVVSPPNNWDSMTYHMSRVAHWAARGDVSYYATHIDRQLFTQPWAEYAILHTYVLAGSDRWANLVQWAAMVVTVVMATLIARNLGLGRSAQVAAAVIVLTLPMGITQATTTQNDYVAAMWIAILAVLATRPARLGGSPVHVALLIGSVVGLAAMAKATTYFFLAPLLLWWLLRRVELKPALVAKVCAAVAIPVLVLVAPGILRNVDTFSRPFGPPLAEFVNEPIGLRATAENVMRHAAVQLGVPSDAVNAKVSDATRGSASAVGLDVDNPGSTFPAGHRFVVTFGYREDDAQAFAATVLLVLSLPVLLIAGRRRHINGRGLTALAGCAVAGGLLLETYFRWNPWNGRYLLPFFVLTAVVSAAAIDQVPRRLQRVVLSGLLASSLLWVLGSDLRPVLREDSVLTTPRDAQYFNARPELREPYQEAAAYARSLDADRVGYVGSGDDWEYPLWVLLNKDGRDVSLESIDVTNASRRYEGTRPDVVICTSPCTHPGGWTVRGFGSGSAMDVSVWSKT